MLRPPLIVSLLAVAMLTSMGATARAVGAIFKCRSGDGHWIYAARPPAGCQGPPAILPLARTLGPRAPRPRGRAATTHPAVATPDRLRARLRRYEATLHALHATRIPRDPALARWRTHALHAVTVDIAVLRHDLGQDRSRRRTSAP